MREGFGRTAAPPPGPPPPSFSTSSFCMAVCQTFLPPSFSDSYADPFLPTHFFASFQQLFLSFSFQLLRKISTFVQPRLDCYHVVSFSLFKHSICPFSVFLSSLSNFLQYIFSPKLSTLISVFDIFD